ncbi:MAG: efflux RND transporter permease subunit, partial [Candidatus Eisenbacteria bacterium]|nr:efflux RND transporter permease subunit [Candidatus Eisenbacteria bacterium]
LRPLFRPLWPDRRRMTWDELVAELNRTLQVPGWTNAWTMPIKTRIDMLSTGIRTPIGIKIYGADLDTIDRIGADLEHVVSRVPETRSVYADRSTGGFYLDIVPDRVALARYGLTVGEVSDAVEAAIGGESIATTVQGRDRFTINVRYPNALREDVEALRHVLLPLHGGAAMRAASAPAVPPAAGATSGERMASAGGAMGGMGGASAPDAGMGAAGGAAMPAGTQGAGMSAAGYVPLGQVADVRITGGPPMIRDEAGQLVGYVYVDIDPAKRDIGGYVDEAKRAVATQVRVPAGYTLQWTGQYELLQAMQTRMRVLIPLTLAIVLLLLFMNFGNLTEALIVLCSVPFALVGSVWLMTLLHHNLSTASWVGIIALVGLAAQTGVVMVVYCDAAYLRRRAQGLIRTLDDIVDATLEGSVQRVRPKLMTVATMLIGLVPLLWSQGAGADVMKRVAAPMVGGLITSAFLTLEIIPVVYTYWRYAQLKAEWKARARAAA